AAYLDPARRVAFYREAERRIAALPGVERVATSSQVPMCVLPPPLFIELAETADQSIRPTIHYFQVSPGYFETMGVRIVKGRGFTESDRPGNEGVVVVSETAARVFWKDRDPIGHRVRFDPDAPWLTVIGVAS